MQEGMTLGTIYYKQTRILFNCLSLDIRPSGARYRFLALLDHISRHPDFHIDILVSNPLVLAELNRSGSFNYKLVIAKGAGDATIFKFTSWIWATCFFMFKDYDYVENLSYPPIFCRSATNVNLIHDCRYLDDWRRVLSFRVLTWISRVLDFRTILVSSAVQKEFCSLLHFPLTNTKVIYNGAGVALGGDIDDMAISNDERHKNFYYSKLFKSINLKYFLVVSHFEKRKNLEILLFLPEKILNKYDIRFVLVGRDSGNLSTILDLVDKKGLTDRFWILNDVSDSQLVDLYRHSHALVFPSKYEGFGMPIIEALKFGKCALLSNIPPFVEIVGSGYPFLFDPFDVESLSNCFVSFFGRNRDDNYRINNELAANFEERFSWDTIGSEYTDFIRGIN